MNFSELKLEDVLLSREDVLFMPKMNGRFMDGSIRVPIHPILFREEISLDRELPYEVLKLACWDFVKDSRKLAKSGDSSMKEYFSRFIGDPKFAPQHENVHHSLKHIAKRVKMVEPTHVYPNASNCTDNGLVISLNETGHVSLGIEASQRPMVPFGFPQRKIDAYGSCMHYTSANTDAPASGLFLRAWSVRYLNAALREAFKQRDKLTVQ